jgi:hypothetical protein
VPGLSGKNPEKGTPLQVRTELRSKDRRPRALRTLTLATRARGSSLTKDNYVYSQFFLKKQFVPLNWEPNLYYTSGHTRESDSKGGERGGEEGGDGRAWGKAGSGGQIRFWGL